MNNYGDGVKLLRVENSPNREDNTSETIVGVCVKKKKEKKNLRVASVVKGQPVRIRKEAQMQSGRGAWQFEKK